jgi:hypothetical protein
MAWFNDRQKATKISKYEEGKGFWLPFEPPSEIIHCFLCSEEIDWGKGVYWNGSVAVGGLGGEIKSDVGYIFMHSDCAKKLSLHLAKDALLCDGKEYVYRAERRA